MCLLWTAYLGATLREAVSPTPVCLLPPRAQEIYRIHRGPSQGSRRRSRCHSAFARWRAGQVPKPCEDVVEYTGRVEEIIFDCYGDLEGFVLADCCSVHSFKTREKEIGEILLRACKDRLTVSVFIPRTGPPRIQKIVVRC
jgi:hypothetical protein